MPTEKIFATKSVYVVDSFILVWHTQRKIWFVYQDTFNPRKDGYEILFENEKVISIKIIIMMMTCKGGGYHYPSQVFFQEDKPSAPDVFNSCWFIFRTHFGRDHVWWRHRPPAAPPPIKYTSSCREDQSRIVSKCCKKSRVRGFHHPHPLVPRWGYDCVYVWGLNLSLPLNWRKLHSWS